MNYKEFTQAITSIISKPRNKWEELHTSTNSGENNTLKLLYWLISINAIAQLVGGLIYDNTLFISIIIRSIVSAASFYSTIWLVYYITNEALTKKFGVKVEKDKLLSYLIFSSVLNISISSIIAIIPGLFFLEILNIYTLYIVWEGAVIMTNIEENKRSNFALLLTICLLVAPYIIFKILTIAFPIIAKI